MKKVLSIVIAGAALLAFAGDKLSTRTMVALSTDPVEATAANAHLQKAKAKSRSAMFTADGEKMRCFIKVNDESAIDSLKMLGVDIHALATTVMTADIPVSQIAAVEALNGVVAIDVAQEATMMMDSARLDTRVNDEAAYRSESGEAFLGKDVIVGMIDGGLDFTHPNFYTSDRTTPRIKRVWLQDVTTGTPPEGFSAGTELTTTEAIETAGTDLQYYSHGSHTTGIAAGADTSGSPYYGIARESDIVFSNFTDTDHSIMNAIKWIFDYADSQDKPAVINMSLGTVIGPHDGTSLRDQFMDEMAAKPGHIMVGATGNNAANPVHISKTITANDTLLVGIGFAQSMNMAGYGFLDFWGDVDKSFKISLVTIDSTDVNNPQIVYKSRNFNAANSLNSTITLQAPFDKCSGFYKIATGKNTLNNRANAYLELQISDYKPAMIAVMITTNEDSITVHGWANTTYCAFRDFLPFMDPADNKYSVCEIGGTGKNIISVGSYNTKAYYKDINDNVGTTGLQNGAISVFSNIGPSIDGRMKPEVIAPGCMVTSSLNGTGTDATRISTTQFNGKTYYYGAMMGTSMAAPHVTGVIATWLQACPTLKPDDIRDVLAHSARSDQWTGATPNNNAGYGKIDAFAGLAYILKNYVEPTSIKDVKTGCQARFADGRLNVLNILPSEGGTVTIYDTAGRVVYSKAVGAQGCGDVIDVDCNHLAKGVYIANIAVGNEHTTLKFAR